MPNSMTKTSRTISINSRGCGKTTRDGSKSSPRLQPHFKVWEASLSDRHDCLGKHCSTRAKCFYFAARARMRDAHVLVVNHALYMVYLALRARGARIIPEHDVVIFDEAHELESIASEHFGRKFSKCTQIQRGGPHRGLVERSNRRRVERPRLWFGWMKIGVMVLPANKSMNRGSWRTNSTRRSRRTWPSKRRSGTGDYHTVVRRTRQITLDLSESVKAGKAELYPRKSPGDQDDDDDEERYVRRPAKNKRREMGRQASWLGGSV